MTAKQLKALEILVSGDYNSFGEVADELKISERTLYNWRKDEEFSSELTRRINIKIGGIAPRALKKIEKLLDCAIPEVALKSAKDILDRAGYKAKEKLDVNADANINACVEVSFEGELNEWSE